MLLEFLNMGGAEIGLILAIVAVPFLLIIYCIVDILRSEFKTGLMKFVFLALVLFAPFIGSIIYLVIRKDYLKSKSNTPMI
jgi:spore maturation protein SpmB